MPDCTDEFDYGETYPDFERLLKLADDYKIDRSKLPAFADIDESNKNTFAEEFNRIANELAKKIKNDPFNKPDNAAHFALIMSLKRRITCYLETFFRRSKGGKKTRRQKKRHRHNRRKSSKKRV
jgi:hypothetical protein